MKKAKINNLIGIGQAQIFGTNGQKECNGYFQAEFNSENAKMLKSCYDSEEIIYSGILIDQDSEQFLSFPIIMLKTKKGFKGFKGIYIEFTATGNPYDNL